MVFSSTLFLFAFLPATLVGYYLIRRELRNVFLLVMSLIFYAVGEPHFVIIMMSSIAANYVFGVLIHYVEGKSGLRRLFMILAVGVNLGILFYFKYYDFAVTNLNGTGLFHLPLRHIALPIGISFFTFQGMSYVLDVYMGKAPAQKNPLNVALYIALFPQLIAGPIVRYSDVNVEIIQRQETIEDFSSGVKRFSMGLAKKVILANNFALLADQAFSTSPEALGAGLAWLGALAYTLQIYFDFSGYSDMAIGLGRMFGFHFRENFDHPYTAPTMQMFWRRWHISLSSWFRDYVYIPLGGNRRGNVYLNQFIVFFLTGLWHGASWNFVFWGLWHGFFLTIERLLRGRGKNLQIPKAVTWIYTMLVVMIGWVFFRAPTMQVGVNYVRCMLGRAVHPDTLQQAFYSKEFAISLGIGCICSLPLVSYIKKMFQRFQILNRVKEITTFLVTTSLLIASIGMLSVTTYNPFIYFNF